MPLRDLYTDDLLRQAQRLVSDSVLTTYYNNNGDLIELPTEPEPDPSLRGSGLTGLAAVISNTARINPYYYLDPSPREESPMPAPAAINTDPNTDTQATMTIVYPSDAEYAMQCNQAFKFLRVHGNGRFSSRTLMSILDAADIDPTSQSISRAPRLFMVGSPFHFDPDTEIKTGGLIAVGVSMEDESRRMIVAVRETHRRQGIGTRVVEWVHSYSSACTAVLGKTNVIGQHFCLSLGMQPCGLDLDTIRYGL